MHERDRIQRAATQRMSSPGYPYRARQRPAQMLQSVACLVGVGKTHLACALGHIAIRRRRGVHMARADKLFKRLKAARLDNTLDSEMRRLATVELLIIDDLALQPLDRTSTTDFYELCVERHQRAATIVTSNRTPDEWLTMMADPLLAQSAVDRLDLVRERFRETGTANGEAVLAEYEADPESFEKGLSKKLAEADASKDEALVAAAMVLLELLDQQGGKSGKYNVTITGSQGIHIGDHGTQTNTFTS
jgi:IstB-like ATP binding protein